MLTLLIALQVLCALGLIALTAVTTTKSEQAGSGFWGSIGGKTSSSIAGLEDQLERLTMYVAIAFLLISALAGIVAFRSA